MILFFSLVVWGGLAHTADFSVTLKFSKPTPGWAQVYKLNFSRNECSIASGSRTEAFKARTLKKQICLDFYKKFQVILTTDFPPFADEDREHFLMADVTVQTSKETWTRKVEMQSPRLCDVNGKCHESEKGPLFTFAHSVLRLVPKKK